MISNYYTIIMVEQCLNLTKKIITELQTIVYFFNF